MKIKFIVNPISGKGKQKDIENIIRENLNAKKYAEAANWFKKAASRGYPQAAYELAKLYLSGNGVSRSKDIAIIWFKEASKYRDSQYQVGKLYENKREYSSALFWYAKATLAGDKNAKDALIKILKNKTVHLSCFIGKNLAFQ